MFRLAYVDDVIFIGLDPQALQKLIQSLYNKFALKDFGPLQYFLGIDVHKWTNESLFLNQKNILVTCYSKLVWCIGSLVILLCKYTSFSL